MNFLDMPSQTPTISPQIIIKSSDFNFLTSYYYAGLIGIIVLCSLPVLIFSYYRFNHPMRDVSKDFNDFNLTLENTYSDDSIVEDMMNPALVSAQNNVPSLDRRDDFVGYLQGRHSQKLYYQIQQQFQEIKAKLFDEPVILKKENRVKTLPLDPHIQVRPFMYDPNSRQYFQGRSNRASNYYKNMYDSRNDISANGFGYGFRNPKQFYRNSIV